VAEGKGGSMKFIVLACGAFIVIMLIWDRIFDYRCKKKGIKWWEGEKP
jgi:hypothetical protein